MGNYSVYMDGDSFYEALANFTQDKENLRFLSDIVYADDDTIEVRERTGDRPSHRGEVSLSGERP